jgi:hypothetical protein
MLHYLGNQDWSTPFQAHLLPLLHPANFAPSQQSAVRYIATVSATTLFLHQESNCPGDGRRRRVGRSPAIKQHPEHPTAQQYLTRSAQGLQIPYCTRRSDSISHRLRSESILLESLTNEPPHVCRFVCESGLAWFMDREKLCILHLSLDTSLSVSLTPTYQALRWFCALR